MIQEEQVKLDIDSNTLISRELSVFYNPLMKMNRDLTIALLHAYLQIQKPKEFLCQLPLEGTGVRGIRIQKDFSNAQVFYNDISPKAVLSIQKHLKINDIKKNCTVFQLPADRFLLSQKMSDFIDVDPFGSPNFFLDSAIKRIKHGGLLAVTATDTAALCGSSKKAGRRKYGAFMNTDIPWKHEFGVRVLIAHIQKISAQFEKALIPIFAYPHKHYYRVFFQAFANKTKLDAQLDFHQYVKYESSYSWKFSKTGFQKGSVLGPLYTGMISMNSYYENKKFLDKCTQFTVSQKWLQTYIQEQQFGVVGTYVLPLIAKELRLSQIPSFEKLTFEIQKKGYVVSQSVFEKEAIRSNIPPLKLKNLLLKLSQ